MVDNKSIVAIYNSETEAEAIVKGLKESGYDMKKISIIGRHNHGNGHTYSYYNTIGGEGKVCGKIGVFWGDLRGLLYGSAMFYVPALETVLIGDAFATRIAERLGDAVDVEGVSALEAGLLSIGISHNSILKYEAAIQADKILIIAHGKWEELASARDLLGASSVSDLTTHCM